MLCNKIPRTQRCLKKIVATEIPCRECYLTKPITCYRTFCPYIRQPPGFKLMVPLTNHSPPPLITKEHSFIL